MLTHAPPLPIYRRLLIRDLLTATPQPVSLFKFGCPEFLFNKVRVSGILVSKRKSTSFAGLANNDVVFHVRCPHPNPRSPIYSIRNYAAGRLDRNHPRYIPRPFVRRRLASLDPRLPHPTQKRPSFDCVKVSYKRSRSL